MVQTAQEALRPARYEITATRYEHPIKKDCMPEDIIREICNYFKLHREQIVSKSRIREIVTARMLAMWFVYYKCPEQSSTSVGVMFGERDHTTVLHAKNTVMNLTNGPTPVWKDHFDYLSKLFN